MERLLKRVIEDHASGKACRYGCIPQKDCRNCDLECRYRNKPWKGRERTRRRQHGGNDS
jgi:hypothetical protein